MNNEFNVFTGHANSLTMLKAQVNEFIKDKEVVAMNTTASDTGTSPFVMITVIVKPPTKQFTGALKKYME
jgi:hypothetical protein